MTNRWCVALMWIGVLMGEAAAQPHKELAAAGENEDEELYRCRARTGPVAVTFKPETELKDLVTWAMGFTCKNFVLDPRIVATGKKVTVIAPNRMSAPEAYEVFLVTLSTIGLTVVRKGKVLRIVESAAARKEQLPIYKSVPDDGERVVRVVIRPTYARPEALLQAFTALKSEAGDIVVVGSLLVVTDFASTLAGMISLKKLIDVPGGTDAIYTIPLRHGDAAKVAPMLTSMFGASAQALPATTGRPGAGPSEPGDQVPSKILVDERTNTLVISGSEAAYQRAKALVDRLDVAIDLEAGGSIHAYQLTSAIAEELAQTLNNAVSGEGSRATPARTAGGAAPAPSPAPLEGLGARLQGAVHVIADKPTNKLLITSSGRDFVALREVIRELDQPRRQVYIEAMILEVDASTALNIGASAHGGKNLAGQALALGGVQLPELSSINPSSALGAGGLVGALLGTPLGSTSWLPGTSIPSYGLLFQALTGRTNANILSTPSLIALDNEEAKSKIGEDVPYLRGVVPATTGATTALAANVERKQLELELSVKPHISAADTILLEIKHSANALKDTSTTLGPTWSTRSVETRVVVRDQQTVLIGGLMQERELDHRSSVPLLGDIPLLGHLFRYTTRSKHKTNLLIMLTPYIIKDQLDLQRIQQRKLRQNDEFIRSFGSLASMKFQPSIDYQRKRGLIEEINRSVQSVEAEVAARAGLAELPKVPAGPVEVSAEPATPGPDPVP